MQPGKKNLDIAASKATSLESDVQWIAEEAPAVVAAVGGVDVLRQMEPDAFDRIVLYVEATIRRTYTVSRLADAIEKARTEVLGRELTSDEVMDAHDEADRLVPDVPNRDE